MTNEYYGMPTTPNDDYLAHYGIRGMKWGVRKAKSKYGIAAERALSRQYNKAQKKLAKLEKRATSGKKYAKRAAALGAGAAAAGGLAAVGTGGVAAGMRFAGRGAKGALKGIGGAMDAVGRGLSERRGVVGSIGNAIGSAGRSVKRAGKNINVTGAAQAVQDWGKGQHDIATAAKNIASSRGHEALGNKASEALTKRGMGSVSNNTLARIGAGAVGAGLAGAAGYNAYRAATTKRAAKKAAQFRSEMNKAFAGTKYANAPRTPQKKKRRG